MKMKGLAGRGVRRTRGGGGVSVHLECQSAPCRLCGEAEPGTILGLVVFGVWMNKTQY